MKQKLVFAAALAAVALVVAPIATANALVKPAVLKGTCYIEGVAKFAPGLLLGVKRRVKYTLERQEVESLFFTLKLKPANTCEGTAEESGGLHKTSGSYEVKEANVEKGNETSGGAADNGELECGTRVGDSTKDIKSEGAVARLKVKGPIGGTEEVYEAESSFYFEETAKKDAIKAKLDSKTGGGGNKAEGPVNFLRPTGFATQKAKCAERPPAPGAEILPFETASLLGTELGITGTVGE